jgi:hypothetical protein
LSGLGPSSGLPLLILLLASMIAAIYAYHLVQQNPGRDPVLAPFLLSIVPTSVVYMRCLDPIPPLVLPLCLDHRETRLLRRPFIPLFPLLETLLTAGGPIHNARLG